MSQLSSGTNGGPPTTLDTTITSADDGKDVKDSNTAGSRDDRTCGKRRGGAYILVLPIVLLVVAVASVTLTWAVLTADSRGEPPVDVATLGTTTTTTTGSSQPPPLEQTYYTDDNYTVDDSPCEGSEVYTVNGEPYDGGILVNRLGRAPHLSLYCDGYFIKHIDLGGNGWRTYQNFSYSLAPTRIGMLVLWEYCNSSRTDFAFCGGDGEVDYSILNGVGLPGQDCTTDYYNKLIANDDLDVTTLAGQCGGQNRRRRLRDTVDARRSLGPH